MHSADKCNVAYVCMGKLKYYNTHNAHPIYEESSHTACISSVCHLKYPMHVIAIYTLNE